MSCSIEIIRRKQPVEEVEHVDVDVEKLLLDLYEKIGILKQRIERLENERSN